MLDQNVSSSPPKRTSNCLNTIQSHQFPLLTNTSEWGESDIHQWPHTAWNTFFSQRLSSISGEVVCSSKLDQVSWSWTELLRVRHYSVFLCQLDNVTKSIFPAFADDTKWAEEGGRGDRWAPIQRNLDSVHDQANKNYRSLSRDEVLHNAIMPSSSSTGCSIAVLQLVHGN